MNQSWIEEFERKYQKPRINRVTVGFSGIDPQEKVDVDAEELLKNIKLVIDSGNIDPDAQEPTPDPTPLVPTEIDHEKLGGLLGGNSNGHYHLTEAERTKLQNIPAHGVKGDKGDAGAAGTTKHEELTDLQGGKNREHYHLTEEETDCLKTLIAFFFVDEIEEDDPDGVSEASFTISA